MMRLLSEILVCGSATALAGCGTPRMDSPSAARSPSRDDAMPVAYAGDERVGWEDLRNTLIESAGGQALAELVLERMVAQRLAENNMTITEEQLDAERSIVTSAASLSDDPNQALLDLKKLRERRGWGPVRYEAMLRRNAALRQFVQEKIRITPEAVRDAYELGYGPKYEARLIMTRTAAQAARLVKRARSGESFSDLAIEHSTDASRAQGGLLPPISLEDPTFPRAVRQMLAQLEPAAVSDPVMLDTGFAILKLERKIERQDIEFDDVKQELELLVRRRAEAIEMQKLARQLLVEAKVTVFDPALNSSWRRHAAKLLQSQEQR